MGFCARRHVSKVAHAAATSSAVSEIDPLTFQGCFQIWRTLVQGSCDGMQEC